MHMIPTFGTVKITVHCPRDTRQRYAIKRSVETRHCWACTWNVTASGSVDALASYRDTLYSHSVTQIALCRIK